MEYKENVLSYEIYHRLRASVGWANFSAAQAQTALANSLYTVIAVENNETAALSYKQEYIHYNGRKNQIKTSFIQTGS